MASPESQISKGSLRAMWEGGPDKVDEPVVQVLQVKQLASAPGTDVKFRVVFSDTVNYIQSMLVTGLNHLVTSEKLRVGCFVSLKSYTPKTLRGRKVVICQDLEILDHLGTCAKIGEPKQMDAEGDEASTSVVPPENFYGNRPQQPQPQPQTRRPAGSAQPYASMGRSNAGANFYPIVGISPYTRTWSIKARCAFKTPIKTYHNKKGEGKLFNATFIDSTGEIRATAFNEQVDKFYHILEEGAVYCISSPCRVNLARKEFSNVNNDYELMFESDTIIEKSSDEIDVPQVKFDFTPLSDLQTVEPGSTTDVIGVLKDAGDVSQIVSKASGKPFDKRELTLVDNTGFSVRLTIWNDAAKTFNAAADSIIAFKSVKVSDFGGRSLSLLNSGTMTIDPDIPEAHRLRGWYDAQGRTANFTSHSSSMGVTSGHSSRDPNQTIAEIRDANLGSSEEPDYFNLKATILMIKQETMCYPACASEMCNKKVIQQEDGLWRCERCNISHESPQYRYILLMNVCDHTGQLWLNCFDDVGRSVMNCSADDYMKMKESDEKGAEDLVRQAAFQTFNFRCRAKQEFYQEMPRTRYQIMSAAPVDASAEASRLADLIKEYSIE
ncbi:Replication factor A protein 1 [Ascosphaera pollenicola]|nr:Replication factor A protein 1 [Ascosphaera pollenicola]